jgi:hypothetical protein
MYGKTKLEDVETQLRLLTKATMSVTSLFEGGWIEKNEERPGLLKTEGRDGGEWPR